jgi:hypothetical protein
MDSLPTAGQWEPTSSRDDNHGDAVECRGIDGRQARSICRSPPRRVPPISKGVALKAPNALIPNVTASEYREDRARVTPTSPLDNAILMMIRAHVGKPCPTRREVMSWTCIPRRQVWVVLGEVQARGLIEIEECTIPPARQRHHGRPVRRRMRVAGEDWTSWTARRPVMVAA